MLVPRTTLTRWKVEGGDGGAEVVRMGEHRCANS